jgi:superfamily II DNA/RNA helicase
MIHRSGRSGHQGQTGTSILLIREEETSLPIMQEIQKTAIPLKEGNGNPYDLSVPMEKEAEPAPDVVTLRINAGKDDKLRPKDIAGAFSQLLPFEKIGRIVIRDHDSTVILLEPIDLQEITIKGKKRKIRQL